MSAETLPEPAFTRDERYLLEQARQAAQSAYCPYSHFPVGAAVESDIGITTGGNIENASYGLAICAERVALFRAIAQGATRFSRLAVSCIAAQPSDPPGTRMPCGACRQVMAEFLPSDAIVVIDGVGSLRVSELLPHAFQLATTPFLQGKSVSGKAAATEDSITPS